MPHQFRQILVANLDQDLDVLAVLADKLIEFPSRLTMQQVSQASSDSSTNDNLADIIKHLDKIETHKETLKFAANSHVRVRVQEIANRKLINISFIASLGCAEVYTCSWKQRLKHWKTRTLAPHRDGRR